MPTDQAIQEAIALVILEKVVEAHGLQTVLQLLQKLCQRKAAWHGEYHKATGSAQESAWTSAAALLVTNLTSFKADKFEKS